MQTNLLCLVIIQVYNIIIIQYQYQYQQNLQQVQTNLLCLVIIQVVAGE